MLGVPALTLCMVTHVCVYIFVCLYVKSSSPHEAPDSRLAL